MEEDTRTNGGGRLAAIDADLAALAAKSAEQRQRFEAYSAAAADLGLQAPEDRVLFYANRARLAGVEQDLAARSDALHEDRTTLSIQQAGLKARSAELKAELTSLQARRNLIPSMAAGTDSRPCATPSGCVTAKSCTGGTWIRTVSGSWMSSGQCTLMW